MTPWSDEIKPLPLYRIDPEYSTKMARNGKAVWVELEFTISCFGLVQDIIVLNSSTRGFDRTSIKAREKWRYAPHIVDGQAVKTEQLKVKLDFTLG